MSGSVKSLVLCFDEPSYQDVLEADVDPALLIVMTSFELAKRFSALSFPTIVTVENFQNTGEIVLKALELFKREAFSRIIAIQEYDILRAAHLRALLNLPGQSVESALAFRNKVRMKEILTSRGFAVPPFKLIRDPSEIYEFLKAHPLPAVLKPVQGTGSESVTLLKNENDLETFLKSGVFTDSRESVLQIESFVDGEMYQINGLVSDGKTAAVWPAYYLSQSVRMLEGKSASSYLLSPENPLVSSLNAYGTAVLEALPTPSNTAFHLEVFVTSSGEIIFCEIASRIGGKGVRRSWMESFGISLGKEHLSSQLPEKGVSQTFSRGLSPALLTGEIWFPNARGTLKAIEKTCPFSWVKGYQVFQNPGKDLENPETIEDCLAGASVVIAESESQMIQRFEELSDWFYTTTRWETR